MQACKKREKKSDVFLKEKFQMKKRTAYCRKGSVSSLTIGCSMHALTTTGTLCSLPLGLEGGARNSRRLIPSLQKVIRYRKPPSSLPNEVSRFWLHTLRPSYIHIAYYWIDDFPKGFQGEVPSTFVKKMWIQLWMEILWLMIFLLPIFWHRNDIQRSISPDNLYHQLFLFLKRVCL